MDLAWRIELFGTLRAEQPGRSVERFRTRKIGGLLAYLALHPRRNHPREELVERFWPDATPSAGRQNLSQALTSLRHQFEPPGTTPGAFLQATNSDVRLNPTVFSTDVMEFEDALQAAERGSSPLAQERALERAISLYRGELLPGYYEDWVLRLRERLAESYLHALDLLIGAAESRGDLARAAGHARRSLLADPLREETYRDLMRLLAARGEKAAALSTYKDLKRRLRLEVGLTPSPETERLARAIESGERQPTALELPAKSRRTARARSVPDGLAPGGTFTILAGAGNAGSGHPFPAALREELRRPGSKEISWSAKEFAFAYPTATDALQCAIRAMRAIAGPAGVEPLDGARSLRLGIDTIDLCGETAEESPPVTHALDLLLAAHPGQILCSESSAALLQRKLDPETHLEDLGLYRLRDDRRTERIWLLRLPECSGVTFPILHADRSCAGNLPVCFTRFFGRYEEIRRLRAEIPDPSGRLLTITGAGGTGKTRLALEVCRGLLDSFPGGVWFVPLADLSDARQLPDVLLSALQIRRAPGRDPIEQVASTVAGRASLFLVDNFEHLVAEGASFLQCLLEQGPEIHLLVTSRHRLGIPAERVCPLEPLETPAGPDTPERLLENPSVQLFVDRAQVVRPDFQVTSANAEALARLCAQLEGIPLAIELAAARAQVMSPAEISKNLSPRLTFLVNRRLEAQDRHRTMRTAIDWSYRLLPSGLQRFFAQLSVFQGTCSAEAAEAICEEPLALDLLQDLREFSLVRTVERVGEMRFLLLDTIREYAAEHLTPEDRAELLDRHARHYLDRVERSLCRGASRERTTWLERLDLDRQNLEAALRFCAADGAPPERARIGARLAVGLSDYWQLRGAAHAGRAHIETFLRRVDALSREERARGLQEAGFLALLVGDYPAATAMLTESLGIWRDAGEDAGTDQSLNHLGSVAFLQGDYGPARERYMESLAIRRRRGDSQSVARTLHNLGNLANAEGEYARAMELLEESLAIKRTFDDPVDIGGTLHSLGNVAANMGDHDAAHRYYADCLKIGREVGDRQAIAHILGNLALVVSAQGDRDRAETLHRESLSIKRDLGDRRGIASSLVNLGALAHRRGDPERAARLLTAASAQRAAIGAPLSPVEQRRHDEILAEVRSALPDADFERAAREGAGWTLEEAVSYALGDH
jgi:predicted ATPase/DNA-binding SARP family transcriptional activator/Tfp pilus assembly protein PilF